MPFPSESPLNTPAPVILAPMGGVSGGSLARAVAEAGGVGLVGVSYGDAGFIGSQLPLLRGTKGLWGVGIVAFTFADRPDLLELVLSHRPPVLALSFGDEDQIKRLADAGRAHGSLVSVQVHDVRGAELAAAAGADLIIAQGTESGGHHRAVGQSLLTLLPEVVDAVGDKVPVAAAGGIVDGRSAAAALSLGASAVMVGTRFVAAEEALTSPAFLQRLLGAGAEDLVSTTAFDAIRRIPWDPAYTATSLRNVFTDTWVGREDALADHGPDLLASWTEAVERDDAEQRPLFAGQAVGRVTKVQPAKTIVAELSTGARDALQVTFDRLQRPETPAPVDDDTVHEWVLDIAYTGPAEEIAQLRESHVRWVRQHVGTGEFLAAGARVPGPGGVIVTNGLTQDRVQELIAEDPWSSAGLVRYEARAFTNGYRSPGLFSLREGEVALVNVAPTSAIEPSVDALTRVVEHVARTADGFGGARLLASTDGDTVINLAHWRSVEDFQAIFDDPEFRRLYDGFAQVIESSRYRLYRTERIIPPGT